MDNLHQFKGTIFEKIVKTGPSKKAGEPDWQMCIMKIESDVKVKGKTITSVCEYIFDWGVSFEEYSKNDYVIGDFYFRNREVKTKNGLWQKEEKRIVWMKHAELENNNRPAKVKGEVSATEIDSRLMAEIPIPEPGADDDMSDLPF